MRTVKHGILAAIALLIAAGAASAQTYEMTDRVSTEADLRCELYLGPHVGYTFLGDDDFRCDCDLDQEDYLLLGGRLGYYLTNNFALELTGEYFPSEPEYWQLTLGGLYNFTPRVPGWNTYLAFGGGASRNKIFEGKGVPIAYLAAGSEYRFGKTVGLRLELKGVYNFETDLSDDFGRYTQDSRIDVQPNVGLLFHFGGCAAPTVVVPPPAPEPPPPPPPAPYEAPPAPMEPAAPPVVEPPPPPAPTTDTIDFDRGSSRITNIAKARLDSVALRLRENPERPWSLRDTRTAATGARPSPAGEPRTRRRIWWIAMRSTRRASRPRPTSPTHRTPARPSSS